jgi:glycosyltransferase involved in cell wall biosynthesis
MQINFFVDPLGRPPERLLDEWHTLPVVAEAAASAGARVTVVQANRSDAELSRGGIDYLFVAHDSSGPPLARSAAFRALLRARAPDVLHVHGLGFAREVIALHAAAPSVPILLQDHADRPPRFWRRALWRRAAAAAAGVSFCARAQAEPFHRTGLLASGLEVFEIPESTSSFTPGDSLAARATTGIFGAPAVLWVGHLDKNKDPLTVLAGVSAATRQLSELQLWCCFVAAPLLPEVQARIERDPNLRDRVHLIGPVQHQRVEQLMRAADLFVLGSRRESTSFALIEALATGLMPVVTDIHSLRALTGNGAVGRLWPCGAVDALGTALVSAAAELGPTTRARVSAHFDQHLSSAALGRKLEHAYLRLTRSRAPHERLSA